MHLLNLKKKTRRYDIKFNVHDTFLEYPSSGTLKIEKIESQIILKSVLEK